MPFQKGQAKPAGSGRKAGSPDAKRHVRSEKTFTPRLTHLAKEVRDRLEEMGLDPISGLVRIGIKAEEAGELNVARACYGELASYVYAKRRAVELSGIAGGPIMIDADPFDAITRELSRIAERSRTVENPPAVQ